MIYNTSDLMSDIPKAPADPTKDSQVMGMQFIHQPFSSGNKFQFSGTISDVLSTDQKTGANGVDTSVTSGGAKKKKSRKPKH